MSERELQPTLVASLSRLGVRLNELMVTTEPHGDDLEYHLVWGRRRAVAGVIRRWFVGANLNRSPDWVALIEVILPARVRAAAEQKRGWGETAAEYLARYANHYGGERAALVPNEILLRPLRRDYELMMAEGAEDSSPSSVARS